MDMGLKGKVVMVTGGTKGNGKAIGIAFAAEGAWVSICDYKEDLLNTVKEEIERLTGGTVFTTKADVTVQEDLQNFTGKTLDRFGRIDILVNSAIGPAASGAAREFPLVTDEELRTAMDRKFLPYARGARAVVPHMIAQRGGRIINIAGNSGILDYGSAHMLMAYNNVAVMRLTTDLAANLAKYEILVNAISPGPVETDRWKELIHGWALERNLPEEEIWKEHVARIPIGKMVKPEDVANLAIFLASERANCITGTVINIDGGMSLRF